MDPPKRRCTDDDMRRFLKAMNLLRVMDREVPGQVVAAFAYVASHNGCHKQALEEDLGLSTASGSRTTDWLSKTHRLGKAGFNLIKKEDDPTNTRRKILTLTREGELLAQQMKDILYG